MRRKILRRPVTRRKIHRVHFRLEGEGEYSQRVPKDVVVQGDAVCKVYVDGVRVMDTAGRFGNLLTGSGGRVVRVVSSGGLVEGV